MNLFQRGNDKRITIIFIVLLANLLPLGDEEDQDDEDLLKHHDEDVESTLTCPRSALHRLPCGHRQQGKAQFICRTHFSSQAITQYIKQRKHQLYNAIRMQ